jgi:hypothetical protein
MMPIRCVFIKLLLIEVGITGCDVVEKSKLVCRPPFVGEDLDLAVAGEAGGVHPVADFANIDAAFTYEKRAGVRCGL